MGRARVGLVIALALVARGARAQDHSLFPEEVDAWQETPAPPAHAAPPTPRPVFVEPPYAPFGSPGQFVITGASTIGLLWRSLDASDAGGFSASFSPGVDYFVVPHVSIGLGVGLDYSDMKGYGSDGSLVDTTITSFSGGPRLGIDVPLGPWFSLYPRLTLGIEWAHRDEQVLAGGSPTVSGSPTGAPSTTQTGPYVSLYAPILWHARPHFFVGVGPSLVRDFGRTQGGPDVGAERTVLGARVVVGGYFGGTPPATSAAEPPPTGPVRPFGNAGELVLTGESDLSASWTTYDGTGSSYTVGNIAPGLDYFVVNHLSIGLGASFTTSKQVGLNGATTVTYVRTAVGAGPRVGVDLPLGAAVSFYPRVGFGVGGSKSDERSGTTQNNPTENYEWVYAVVPLLLHVAPHLFAGFGPTLRHDMAHGYAYPNGFSGQNRLTELGAALLVGGWL